ncbi:MAG: hypothetical protein K2W33_13815, partial [Burkholderiales bacterium]|nr:hypothetical protein [Burkholderiales bacterium]
GGRWGGHVGDRLDFRQKKLNQISGLLHELRGRKRSRILSRRRATVCRNPDALVADAVCLASNQPKHMNC